MNSQIESVLHQPLGSLQFDVRLRRELMRAGYSTLHEVINASNVQLFENIDKSVRTNLYKLLMQLKYNQAGFVEEVLSKQKPNGFPMQDELHVEKQKQGTIDSIDEKQPIVRRAPKREASLGQVPIDLFNSDLFKRMMELEDDAKVALNLLEDHAESAIVAESFPLLNLELDELKDGFSQLFTSHIVSSSTALNISCSWLKNSFLIFVALSASEHFDGDALWLNLFEELGLQSQADQIDLKASFYEAIKEHGFPYYSKDESGYKYFYTALLHGGFSEGFWKPIWQKAILPYAKAHKGAQLTRRDAALLLSLIKKNDQQGDGLGDDESHYAPRRVFVTRLLEKLPVASLEPLIESALLVASEIIELDESKDDTGYELNMMLSHGLPDTAMQALRTVLETQREWNTKRVMYLPNAELRIDPGRGVVLLHWDAQRLPKEYAGRRMEYYVNGELFENLSIKMSVGKCILSELNLEVKPSERFDVEIVMHDNDERATRLASLTQTFDRTRPGTFEFVLKTDGVFRLRNKNERINSEKTVAFLTKSDLWVVPGSGMTSIEEYETQEDWNGASIQIFKVEPASSGSIINLLTNEEVACWQEDYRIEIDRSHVIGKAEGKKDLFGFTPGIYNEVNASLPVISIETQDVMRISDDLDIACTCDGKDIVLPVEVIQDENADEYSKSGRLLIKLNKAYGIDKFVVDGQLRVLQKSSEQRLLEYKFSSIPARSFGIEELCWRDGELFATYTFDAAEDMTIPTEDGDYEMVYGDKFYFEGLLKDEAIETHVVSGITGRKMDVQLFLANIQIDIPDELKRVDSERSICMCDVERDGKVTLTSSGRRQTRKVRITMGDETILYKKLTGKTDYSFDLFLDPKRFAINGKPEKKEVMLYVTHGECIYDGGLVPATSAVVLLGCETGFRLGIPHVTRRYRNPYLVFENEAMNDYFVEFVDFNRNELLKVFYLKKGQKEIPINEDIAYLIRIKGPLAVTVMPYSMFNLPDESLAVTYSMDR